MPWISLYLTVLWIFSDKHVIQRIKGYFVVITVDGQCRISSWIYDYSNLNSRYCLNRNQTLRNFPVNYKPIRIVEYLF